MAENNSKTRLDSWKEIADYLVRDVRTVIRWEKDKGLPVHRVPGGKRHAVFAYPAEIDAWLASGSAALNGVTTTAPSPQAPAWGRTGSRWRVQPFGYALGRPGSARRVAVGLIVLVLLAGVVAAVRYQGRRELPQVERVTFRGSEVVAIDSRGDDAWVYRSAQPLLDDLSAEHAENPRRLSRIVDLNGDGRNEALAVLRMQASPNPADPVRTQLVCFSPRGEVLWKYEATDVLTFGGIEYKGPWRILDVLVVPASPRPLVWVVFTHHLWFASFVKKIDPATGHAEIWFVNSGALLVLGYLDNEQDSWLLAGGFNSEYEFGSLAVLDAKQAFAASPQTFGSRYHCESCPEGSPQRYFLFPRSEVNRLTKTATNYVYLIGIQEEGVKVSTMELSVAARAIYEFPPNLDPRQLRVVFTSPYWMEHETLEREGKIHHSAQKCPDRVPSRVRVWSPDDGWAEVARLNR
ncbi:MAG: hypothetical protein ACRD4U_05335 [Candidatus Acidiferrales bacterium]